MDYAYDHAGNLTSSVYDIANGADVDRSLDLAYDGASRLAQVSCAAGGAAGTYATSYDYYDSGELRTRTLEAAGAQATTTYAYDISGRLASVEDPAAGGSFSYTWDADSRLTRLDLPQDSGYTTYTYFAEGLTHTQAVSRAADFVTFMAN